MEQNGTLFADPIMASSPHTDCIDRPDRRLLPTNARSSNFSCNVGAIHRGPS